MSNHTPETEKINETLVEEIRENECSCLLTGMFKATKSALIWRGIIFAVFGVLLLFKPMATFTLIVLILGIYAIIEGAAITASTIQIPGNARLIVVLNGLALIILGVAAIIFPWLIGEYAIIFLGIWQFISGIQCMLLIKASHHRWRTFFTGLASIIAGAFLIIAPFIGLLALTWLFALLFFATGAMMLYSGSCMIPPCTDK